LVPNIETIGDDRTRYAIIIRSTRWENGVKFFTPDDAPLQIGAFHLSAGHEIQPHVHKPCVRQLDFTSEVLVIQSGKIQVDFYDQGQTYLLSRTLQAGDTVILLEGGHGFTVLEELRMLEIKQGPFAGMNDKVRFQRPMPAAKR
jgi:hypothetical protein